MQDGNWLRVWIVSHGADSLRHYGAIAAPRVMERALPVLLFCHWGDAGVAVDSDWRYLMQVLPGLSNQFVHVIPSFRSEKLVFGAKTWRSRGNPSPWSGDVADALGLVAAAESLSSRENALNLDASRIRAVGISRGGWVALLAALRDSRIERVVDYFGPTDFLGDYARDVVSRILRGDTLDLPGVRDLQRDFLLPWTRGEFSTSALRIELLSRSPAWFAGHLPPLLIHHGSADSVVWVSSQSRTLWQNYQAVREAPAGAGYIEYVGAGHSPLGMLSQVSRTADFLLGTTSAAARRAPEAGVPDIRAHSWIMPGLDVIR